MSAEISLSKIELSQLKDTSVRVAVEGIELLTFIHWSLSESLDLFLWI